MSYSYAVLGLVESVEAAARRGGVLVETHSPVPCRYEGLVSSNLFASRGSAVTIVVEAVELSDCACRYAVRVEPGSRGEAGAGVSVVDEGQYQVIRVRRGASAKLTAIVSERGTGEGGATYTVRYRVSGAPNPVHELVMVVVAVATPAPLLAVAPYEVRVVPPCSARLSGSCSPSTVLADGEIGLDYATITMEAGLRGEELATAIIRAALMAAYPTLAGASPPTINSMAVAARGTVGMFDPELLSTAESRVAAWCSRYCEAALAAYNILSSYDISVPHARVKSISYESVTFEAPPTTQLARAVKVLSQFMRVREERKGPLIVVTAYAAA